MKRLILISCILTVLGANLFAQSTKVLPTKSQLERVNSEIVVLIHYDINVFAPQTFDYSKKRDISPIINI